MVLIKMSSNVGGSTYKTDQNDARPINMRVIKRPILPPTTFDNPILLSSPSSSSDEEKERNSPRPAGPPPAGPPPTTSTPPSHNTSKVSNVPSSAGSHCESTRSERFCLTGEFSSFDSDVFVSGTSDSASSSEDEATSCQPLSELRNLITRRSRRIRDPQLPDEDIPLIVLSEYSTSDDEDTSSDSSTSDPLFKPPSSLAKLIPSQRDLPQSLTLSIPLHLVTTQKQSTPSYNKIKRPFPLSHFATSKKRAINDPSILDTPTTTNSLPKPPISLKLTKSPTGSSWRSTTPIDSPSPNKHITSNNKTPPKIVSPPSNNNRTVNEAPSQSVIGLTKAPPVSIPGPTKTDSDSVSSKANHHPSGLHEDDMTSLTSNSSVTTSSSATVNGHVPKSSNKVPSKSSLSGKRRYKTKPITNIKNVKSTICFEKYFAHCSPDLVQFKGDLRPLHSLSLRNVNSVPIDHPIHTWTLGRPVPKIQSHKSSPSNHVTRGSS